jgi:hypothetical protein
VYYPPPPRNLCYGGVISHRGGYEELCLLEYNGNQPTFRCLLCSLLASCWFSPDCAIAQVVSHRTPTLATWVRFQVVKRGLWWTKSTGSALHPVHRFPLPVLVSPNAPYSPLARSWYNKPISGRRAEWSYPHPTQENSPEDGCDMLSRNTARLSTDYAALSPCHKPEGRGFETRWSEWIFLIYLILPTALGPGVYSASNKNESQKQKNYVCVSGE